MADEPKISPTDAVKMIIPIDVAGVRAGLAKVLQVPASADFIRRLLELVSKNAAPDNWLVQGGDVLKIYDVIKSQRGMIRAGAPGSEPGANFALGTVATGDAAIQIGVTRPGLPVTLTELTAMYLKSDTATALHETLHHAGRHRYSDQDFAIAVSGMPGDRPPLPVTTNRFEFSRYWDDELRKQCNLR